MGWNDIYVFQFIPASCEAFYIVVIDIHFILRYKLITPSTVCEIIHTYIFFLKRRRISLISVDYSLQ